MADYRRPVSILNACPFPLLNWLDQQTGVAAPSAFRSFRTAFRQFPVPSRRPGPSPSSRPLPFRARGPWVSLWLLLAAGLSLQGEGFRNPPSGAFNLGRAGGRIAQVDDPSAVAQNPANLNDLTAPEFSFSPSLVYIHIDYHSPTGGVARTVDPWKALPNFFGAVPLASGKMAVGLGITTPYGLSNEWDPGLKSPIRYTAPHFTELKTINLNPSFAVRLAEPLSLGVGLDAAWSQLTFKQFLNPAVPALEGKAKGDGWGLGGNVGLTWQVTPRQRLAATYRSPLTVDYEGHFTTKHSPVPGPIRTDFDSRIKFPTIVSVGYGLQLTDTIRLESDVEWIEFSRFKSLPVTIGPNPLGVPSTQINEAWHDTFTAGLAGDWAFHPHWVARAGYQFYESPVPDKTLSPTIPDANQHVLTVGLGWHSKKQGLEVAYGLDFYDHRTVRQNQNPAFNGSYDITVHLFAFNYRYAF